MAGKTMEGLFLTLAMGIGKTAKTIILMTINMMMMLMTMTLTKVKVSHHKLRRCLRGRGGMAPTHS
jgi:hypothetical protein